MVYLDNILHTYTFQHYPATSMQNDDEALPSIIAVDRGLLVKMLITLEPHNILTKLCISLQEMTNLLSTQTH